MLSRDLPKPQRDTLHFLMASPMDLKIAVMADGRITIDGSPATIESLRSSRTLGRAEGHGVVLPRGRSNRGTASSSGSHQGGYRKSTPNKAIESSRLLGCDWIERETPAGGPDRCESRRSWKLGKSRCSGDSVYFLRRCAKKFTTAAKTMSTRTIPDTASAEGSFIESVYQVVPRRLNRAAPGVK